MKTTTLDLSRPMASLREATGLTTTRFAHLRGVAGPTQIQAEAIGPAVGLRVLATTAATFGHAIEFTADGEHVEHPARWVPVQDEIPDVSVEHIVAVMRGFNFYGATALLLPIHSSSPAWMHAAVAARKAREAAMGAEDDAKAAARATQPPSRLAVDARRIAEDEHRHAAEDAPKTIAEFRATLEGTALGVFDARIVPRLSNAKAPVLKPAEVARLHGVARQAVHEHEVRLVERLRVLKLAGALQGPKRRPASTDGARA